MIACRNDDGTVIGRLERVNHGFWLAEDADEVVIGVWETRATAREAVHRHHEGLPPYGAVKPLLLIGPSPR